jgi:hypothetical protein
MKRKLHSYDPVITKRNINCTRSISRVHVVIIFNRERPVEDKGRMKILI